MRDTPIVGAEKPIVRQLGSFGDCLIQKYQDGTVNLLFHFTEVPPREEWQRRVNELYTDLTPSGGR